jgi:hypothetical protein
MSIYRQAGNLREGDLFLFNDHVVQVFKTHYLKQFQNPETMTISIECEDEQILIVDLWRTDMVKMSMVPFKLEN